MYDETSDDDFAIPFNVKAAAALLLFAGMLTAGAGLQQLTVPWHMPYKLVPIALTVFGVVSLASGAALLSARAWASVVGTVCAVVLTVGGTAWAWFTFSHGVFSLLVAIASAFSLPAMMLLPLSIKPSIEATRRLRDLMTA